MHDVGRASGNPHESRHCTCGHTEESHWWSEFEFLASPCHRIGCYCKRLALTDRRPEISVRGRAQ